MRNAAPVLLSLVSAAAVLLVVAAPAYAQQEAEPIYRDIMGSLQLKINDSDGNLVGFMQTPKIRILEHEIIDAFFDTWKFRHEEVIDGTTYNVVTIATESVAAEKSWSATTEFNLADLDVEAIGYTGPIPDAFAFYAAHQQILLERGDTLGIVLTMLRPVG